MSTAVRGWLDGASRALLDEGDPPYRLTRFAFLRVLGLVYFAAFASAAYQIVPLLGEHGLLPAQRFVQARTLELGSSWAAFLETPSLFFWHVSDGALLGVALLGTALSLAVLAGVENAVVMIALWALYLSIDHVGQRFWGYGWEMLLIEVGLTAVFLCPLRSVTPLSAAPVPRIGVWLMRWVLFRLILGAGLIKLRGDPCWTELTCTAVHYETQPIPNPLSWVFHQAPSWVHEVEGAFVLLAEVIAPLFFFGPRRLRLLAGLIQVLLQLGLILSGNLSFLNYLTLALSVWLFDDRALARLVPARLQLPLAGRLARPNLTMSRLSHAPLLAFAALIAYLSWHPVLNLLSDRQRMNESYNGLHLASSYGMFGGMGHERPELSIEGTDAERPDDSATWREYQLPCKPGDVTRAPCVIAPFQPRLDWQVWFAAMSDAQYQPWLIHMIPKLLENDPAILRMFAHNPFPRTPPRFIRIVQWRYTFTRFGEAGWWKRERLRLWLRPVGKDDPEVARYLTRRASSDAGPWCYHRSMKRMSWGWLVLVLACGGGENSGQPPSEQRGTAVAATPAKKVEVPAPAPATPTAAKPPTLGDPLGLLSKKQPGSDKLDAEKLRAMDPGALQGKTPPPAIKLERDPRAVQRSGGQLPNQD